jgi:alkylation response protein AidB-like acyl-CoA dehydrogenase
VRDRIRTFVQERVLPIVGKHFTAETFPKDERLVHPVQISIAKRNNVREALKTAREARALLGANGITVEYLVSRYMNDLESVSTYEGTDDIHLLIIGQALTGMPCAGYLGHPFRKLACCARLNRLPCRNR